MKKIRLERKELPANHVARSCFLFFHFSFSLPSPPMWLSTRKTLLPLDSDSRRIFSLLLSHLLVLSFADLTPHFVRSRLSRACLEPDRGPGFSLTYRSDVGAVYTTTEIPCFHTKKTVKVRETDSAAKSEGKMVTSPNQRLLVVKIALSRNICMYIYMYIRVARRNRNIFLPVSDPLVPFAASYSRFSMLSTFFDRRVTTQGNDHRL